MSAREVLFDAILDNETETPWDIAGRQLAALSAAGFAVVPVEPTEAMKAAAARINHARDHEIYRAMVEEWITTP